MKRCQSFPIHFWVDLLHVFESSRCLALHFRGYRSFFCLPPALSIFAFRISGYFSPDVMVTALSVLSSLRSLDFEFQSPRSHPDHASRRPPPPTRTILSVLTRFSFGGLNEYLDDLVARINAPRVNDLSIDFFNDIVFDTPQSNQFISRTLTLEALENAHVVFRDYAASVNISSQTYEKRSLKVGISRRALDRQVSSLEQVCTSCLPPLSSTEDLYIHPDPDSRPHWQDNIENSLWLGLLHPFGTVKNITYPRNFAPYRPGIARACWGQNDGSAAHPAEYFLGRAPAIGTCPGRH